MKKHFLILAILFSFQFSFAQNVTFKEDVIKVIQKSGATAQMQLAKEEILKNIPEDKKADFSKEFDASLPSLYEDMAGVYMNTYTHEDIKEMLKFYDSPVGKKMNDKAGELFKNNMIVAKKWGTDLQTMMMKYLK